MAEVPYVESGLQAFFAPDFVTEGRHLIRVDAPFPGMLDPAVTARTRIHDARQLQRDAGQSEAAFFEAHGFVLLEHASAVEDWDVDPALPLHESPLYRTYAPEAEALVQRLLPGRRLEVWQGAPVRRGPGTPNPDYAEGVHQDFGLSADDYEEALDAFTNRQVASAWRHRYEQDDVEACLVIDLWRTVGMREPLRNMPLALCDPGSVQSEDIVPIGVLDLAPSGKPTNQTGLRHHPAQRWYYYPRMTGGEVLAFKNLELHKGEADPPPRACFHSAFHEPGTPADAEPRQSSEHRVTVFCLAGDPDDTP